LHELLLYEDLVVILGGSEYVFMTLPFSM